MFINFYQIKFTLSLVEISNYELTVCPALFASINSAYNTHTGNRDDLIKWFVIV